MEFRRQSAVRRILLSLLSCGLVAIPLAAQPKAKDADSKPAPAIKLPSGAIIVVTSDPNSIDKSASVYLTPERYKELNDQIDLLKKQVAAEKPAAPSSCELDGRIEQRGTGNIVRVRATFKFRTTQPRSVIFLGCQKMRPVEAKSDDDKLPLLAASDKGLSVLVEEAGDHTLRLELESSLLPRGPQSNEIGFEIGLPGAPITLLSFATPAKVQRVTISRREITATPLLTAPVVEGPIDVKRLDVERLHPSKGGEPLGPITYLAVSWEDEGRVVGAAMNRSAEADVQVTVGDTELVAEARLRLKGPAKEWRFVAPSNAEVSVGRAPGASGLKPLDFPIDQAPDIVRPEPGQSIWRIRFRETSTSDLLAVIVARAPRNRPEPKAKSLWPVGPFAVLDLSQQSGSIRIKAPPHIKIIPVLKGDTQRLDSVQDPGADSVFRYRSVSVGPNNQPLAPLELDIRDAAGIVQTHIYHQLRIGEGGWRLHTEITVTPIRKEVDSLDFEVPTAVVFEAVTPRLVESIAVLRDLSPQRRVIQVKLATAQRSEFTLALEGFYPLPIGAQEMTLTMPRVLNAFDRTGQVTVAAIDGFDLHGNAYQWESDKPGTQPQPLEPPSGADKTNALTATVSRSISHVELSWKPQRSDMRVESQVDITLGDRQGKVIQALKYQFADRLPKKLRVRASSAVNGLAANPGSLEVNGPLDWSVIPPEIGKDTTIVLSYSFSLPSGIGEDQTPFAVPLLWPDGAMWCESRVRVWRDRQPARALLVNAEGNAWEERPPEVVPNEPSLPLLVLYGSGANLPLTLRMIEAGPSDANSAITSIWIDRALIQARTSGAYQQYRARFHLSKWSARTFNIELPPGATDAEISLNGMRVDSRDEKSGGDAGRTLRILLPSWRDRLRALVEVKYQLAYERNTGIDSLLVEWQPPHLSGRVALSQVRWQVTVPANSVPLSLGAGTFEERWTVRNGIAQPVAAHSTADLEKWIASGREPDGSETLAGWEMADAGVTARQGHLAPLRIAVAPRPLFFAAISLLVLAFGLTLSRLPKRAVGVFLSLMAAGAVVVGVLWPQPAGQVLSAAQPGVVLLVAILSVQRFLQWRYRRRLTRMPGFTRMQVESTRTRSNGQRIPRETSTVDSPAAS